MSSTHMDFSPSRIDRQQEITSWPEGDISGLKTREQNRYRKRKAAIIEYFQSDAAVEEISARHNLPAKDSLEVLARRCLMLHEDGQVWGLRALVPGVRVVDHGAASAEENASSASAETGEVAAISLMKAVALPETPAPASGEEVEQEDFPANVALELPASEESEQEDFPANVALELPASEEVAQEDFPLSVEMQASEPAEVAQEDFPVHEKKSSSELEESEQEASPVNEENERLIDSEVEQKEILSADALEIAQEAVPLVEDAEEPTIKLANKTPVAETVEETKESEPEKRLEVVSAVVETVEEARISQDKALSTVTSLLARDVASEQAEPEAEEEHAAPELVPAEDASAHTDEPASVEEHAEVVELAPLEVAQITTAESDAQIAQITTAESDAQVADAETIAVPTATLVELAEAERVANLAAPETLETASVVAQEQTTNLVESETAEEKTTELAATETFEGAAEQEIGDLADAETVETSILLVEEKTADLTETATALVVAEEQAADLARDETVETLAGWDKDVIASLASDSQQVGTIASSNEPTQPLVEPGHYQITGSQVALKRAVFRRWNKQKEQKKHRRWVKIVSAAIIVSILVGLAIPLIVGLVGYGTYSNIKGVAYDGINNLMAIKELIPANKNDLLSALDPQKLTDAQNKLSKAQSDFLQLQATVNRPDIQSLLQQWAPQYTDKLDMARHLVQVALDVSQMGQELIGVAKIGVNIVHGGALLSTSSNKPLLTANDVNSVQAALVHAQYYISDIQTQMSQVNLAQMPFGSKAQKAEITKYLKNIPQAQSMISQVQGLVGPVSWLLGVGSPRNFLVQTLDRGELRPSGGFEGQYGILTLNGGRMEPFSLKDITLLDYAANGNELGNHPPSQYKWMDFGNFGVRDANLSADYPTTARIVMQLFQAEGGGPVDGDIQITPVVIEQFLQLTGPIYISQYNDTITAQNLEQKLHAYQQDPRLIAMQKRVTNTNTHESRKAFTSLVGEMLMARAKHLKMNQLMDFGKVLFKDLKSRDLQIYFNNPVAEQWLQQNDDSGAMPSFTNGVDGFMVVQANISISKAAQYVQSTFNDQVTLDGNGGARHDLTITLNYKQSGPVYGFNTYADYLRVYAPANAQYLSGYGFETGSTLCTSTTKASAPTNNNGGNNPTPPGGGNGGQNNDTTGSYRDIFSIYGCGMYYHTSPNSAYRYCSNGNYELGYDGMMAKPWPIQELGGPKEMGSDLPGYNMWGGMTLTPKNCTSTIKLSWYVPNVVQHTPGQSPYQMIVGHQAGWPDNVQVSINASAQKGLANLSFNNTIDDDTLVALPALPKPQQPKSTPTPTPTATPGGKKKK